MDARELGFERIGEPAFALHCRLPAGFLHDHRDGTRAVNERRQSTGRGTPAVVIVGSDEGSEPIGCDAGIKNGDRDAGGDGALHRRDERVAVGCRDRKRIYVHCRHGVGNLDLTGIVGLLLGAVPKHFDPEIALGRTHARMDRDEEKMRGGLRNHTDHAPMVAVARGQRQRTKGGDRNTHAGTPLCNRYATRAPRKFEYDGHSSLTMYKLFSWRAAVLLALTPGLSTAASLSADAICAKVAETYRKLAMYQFAAQLQIETFVRGATQVSETYYALAAVKPQKVRLTVKNADRELIIASDGETTWKYLPKSRQYTKEEIASVDDRDEAQPQQGSDVDPLTDAENRLVNRFTALSRYAPIAVLAREDRVKVAGEKIDCYVVQMHLPSALQELWIDKERFLVLREVDTARSETNGIPIAARATLTFKDADIANAPEAGMFTIAPPANAVEVPTLNLPGERPNLTGRVAQDFTLKSLDGGKISLSELRGKVVLLDFWATWCPPCRKELPTVAKLSQSLKEKNVVVLGVNDEDKIG